MGTRTSRDLLDRADRLDRPIAVDLSAVVGLIAVSYLWAILLGNALAQVNATYPLPGRVLGVIVTWQLLYLGGFAGVAVLYLRIRGLDVGLALPRREHLPIVGAAAIAPAALIGLTKATGALTGVTIGELVLSHYGSAAGPTEFLVFAVVSPLGTSVGLALTCQVLFQETFAGTVDRGSAAPAAATVAGFLLLSDASGLAAVTDRGTLIAAVLFAAALWLAVVANERAERDWLRALAALPATVLVALAVFEGVAEIESLAGALLVVTYLATLGIAAYGYERTGSLVVPVLAYASVLVATEVVAFALEAGV